MMNMIPAERGWLAVLLAGDDVVLAPIVGWLAQSNGVHGVRIEPVFIYAGMPTTADHISPDIVRVQFEDPFKLECEVME